MSVELSHPPSCPVYEILQRINLLQYYPILIENGFDDWTTILDITEPDLAAMAFKLGHRRTLQREIATFYGHSPSHPLPIHNDAVTVAYNTYQNAQLPRSPRVRPSTALHSVVAVRTLRNAEGRSSSGSTSSELSDARSRSTGQGAMSTSGTASSTSAVSGERGREGGRKRYRRGDPRIEGKVEPKAGRDAFTLFATSLYPPHHPESSSSQSSQTLERKWRNLPPVEKQLWEDKASVEQERYEVEMGRYKRSERDRKYREYLNELGSRRARRKEVENEGHRNEEGGEVRSGSASEQGDAGGKSGVDGEGSEDIRS